MSIDPVEFGELKGMLQATHTNTEKLLDKFENKLEEHDDRIVDLESHRSTMKRAIKWIGGGVSAIAGFVAWMTS